MIEARALSDFFASDQVEVHTKAHFVLDCNPGAGSWLTSLSNSSETHLAPLLFTVSLRRRLRLAIWEKDSVCPLCGQIQDRCQTMQATEFAVLETFTLTPEKDNDERTPT